MGQLNQPGCPEFGRLQSTTLLALLLGALLLGCHTPAQSPPDRSPPAQSISFANPPPVGNRLIPQHDLVGCTSKASAQYVSATGFKPSECELLGDFNAGEYKVVAREKLTLAEGDIWLLQVNAADVTLWVPLPWHNWA